MARTKNAEQSGFGLGIHILQHLVDAPAPQGVSQVSKALGLAVSSTHDTLHLLMELGFVEMREETKTYRITPRLLDLASHIAHHFSFNARIRQALLDFSHEEGLSACLCILDGCMSRISFASGPLGSTVVIGAGGPVYATSAGKVMVASLPEAEWVAFMPAADAPHRTPDTNTDPGVFRRELENARETGIAWNRKESENNIVSVSAAIRARSGETRGAVALMFETDDMRFVSESRMEEKVRDLAARLSSMM